MFYDYIGYFTNFIIMRIFWQIWINNQDISPETNFKIFLQNAMTWDFKGFWYIKWYIVEELMMSLRRPYSVGYKSR